MPADNTGRRLSLTEVLDAYMAEHAEVKVVDPRRQRDGCKHLKRIHGAKPIADLGIPESREYVRKRTGEGAAPSTIRRELNIVTAAANHCRRWRTLSADQLPVIELPEVPRGEQIMWFTKTQVADMFRARPSGHFGCFLRLTYFTAARRRSIEKMKKSQIDLVHGVIHLAQPGERVTKKRRPTVPLYPEIRPAVEWLLANSGTPYLFGRSRDFYKPFAELMEEMKIEGHPHMLRHSRATHMLQDGESLFKVARLLGDSVATVEKVYAHAGIDFLATQSRVDGAEVEDFVREPRAGQFRVAAE